jgi:two-component system response regulator NreC
VADTELIGAIRAVAREDAFLTVESYQRLAEDYLARVRRGEETGHFEHLTAREQDVLRRIAEGYTNQEIACQLVISVKTVETHRAHILDKLDLHTRSDLVAYALRHGLLDVDQTADEVSPVEPFARPRAAPRQPAGLIEISSRSFWRPKASRAVR